MTMTAPPVNAGTIAPLRNVSAMLTLAKTLIDRPAHLSSGFGVLSGPSGYGKSVAATYTQNRLEALYIGVREYQSRWILDNARLKLMEKGRQIGLSWSTAFATVSRTALASARHDQWVAAPTQSRRPMSR